MNDRTPDTNRKRPATDRRRFLGALAGAGVPALAGCLDGDSGSDGSDETSDEDPEDIDEELRLNGEVLRQFFPLQLYDGTTDDRVAEVHRHDEFSHWHFVPFEVPLAGYRPVEARIYTDDDEVLPLGPDEQFQLEVTRTEETPGDLLEVEVSGQIVNVHGTSNGEGDLVFHLVEDGERVWTPPPMWVVVGDPDEAGDEEETGNG